MKRKQNTMHTHHHVKPTLLLMVPCEKSVGLCAAAVAIAAIAAIATYMWVLSYQ